MIVINESHSILFGLLEKLDHCISFLSHDFWVPYVKNKNNPVMDL